jgi:hypothetical protein
MTTICFQLRQRPCIGPKRGEELLGLVGVGDRDRLTGKMMSRGPYISAIAFASRANNADA